MVQHEREIQEGRLSKKSIASRWSDGMVKDILDNDFYIGTLRLKKRARNTIHGKDKRVPKEDQYVFENHHPAIIDKATFALVQELKEKRNRTNYRGSRGQWIGSEIPNPFATCLFCKDCGNRLTPVKRQTSKRERKYYICSTYNTKGRRYCSKAHLIEEDELMEDVITYIKLCRNALCQVINTYDLKDLDSERIALERKQLEVHNNINEYKQQLKVLLAQKIKDMASAGDNQDLLNETYDSMQKDLLCKIQKLEVQLKDLNTSILESTDVKVKLNSALDVVDRVIAGGKLRRQDIELLIEKITVDSNGMPEITLKYGLSDLIDYSPATEINYRENTIIAIIMKLVAEDNRGYTSAKYISESLTKLGFNKSKRKVLPYINLMKSLQILEDTDNSLKPYKVLKTPEEITVLINNFLPDLPATITASELSDQYLHCSVCDRWHAGNGI